MQTEIKKKMLNQEMVASPMGSFNLWFDHGSSNLDSSEMKQKTRKSGFYSEEEFKLLLEERLKSIANGTAPFIQQDDVKNQFNEALPVPCAYSHEQMEASLLEAEKDFQNGRYVNHTSICERYGV